MEISIDYEGKIGDDYNIIRKLGEGGCGEVYLVKDNNTNEEYAAKTINDDDIFKNEVQINDIVNKIDSSNILKYFSSGTKDFEYLSESETKNFIIFEYCEYKDLFDYIPEGGFKEKIVKIIFKTLLETVDKIHKKDVCHLDLKIENILVDKDFNLKISDFGLSKQINILNNGIFKEVCGTTCYKPPQMYLGGSYNGFKADIFSLGVILYALLTYNFLFQKASPKEDSVYKYIVESNKIEVLEELKEVFPKNIAQESRQIFLDMISLNEKDRPEIKDILKNKWFDDIKHLNDEEKKKIVKDELKKQIDQKELNKPLESKPKEKQDESMSKNKLFDKMSKIKCLKKKIKFDNYLEIKGDLNPINFMNEFANEMNIIFDDVEANKNNYLNFNIIKKKEDEEEKINVEEKINLKEKMKELEIKKIEKMEKDLIIQVELIKVNDNESTEYLLNFIKIKGAISDFYRILKMIMGYVKDFI